MNLDFSKIPAIDDKEIEERVAGFRKPSLTINEKVSYLKLALSVMDLTTLSGRDTDEIVKQLCFTAKHLTDNISDVNNVAAVCVYPNFVHTAKEALKNTSIYVASVAGAFPSGQTSLAIKLAEAKYALDEGVDEIDMVINRGKLLSGEYHAVFDEIAGLKEICGTKHLKVILETGQLDTLQNVRIASEIAIAAGADFIKTSTGKNQPAATLEATYVMMLTIKDYYERSNKMIGIKPAGGIATADVALSYLYMLKNTLGEDWMTRDYFRFGASRLAQDLISEIEKCT